MRKTATHILLAFGLLTAPAYAQGADEKLFSCETSLGGERTQINYVKDAAYHENVGRIENRFSAFGKVSCPGYVTLREILRRNGAEDDGSYCLLWDKQSDTYLGVQKGPRKGNAICKLSFCQRVNSAKVATFKGANAAATAGFDAVTQRPGATLLSATTGGLAGTLESAGAAAVGVASSPVAVGAILAGAAATGGAVWYCSDGTTASNPGEGEPLAEPEPFVPHDSQLPPDMRPPAPGSEDDTVWTSPLPEAPKPN